MNKLTKELVKKNEAPVKVLQFGEGNFMRGFVDWQIQQLNNQQLFKGNVAIIQPLEQGLGNMMTSKTIYIRSFYKDSAMAKSLILPRLSP